MDPSVLGLTPIKGELAKRLGVKESARRYLTRDGREISRRAAMNLWAQYVSNGQYQTYYKLQKALKSRDSSQIKEFLAPVKELTKTERSILITYSTLHEKVEYIQGQPKDRPVQVQSILDKLGDRKYDWYRSFYYI